MKKIISFTAILFLSGCANMTTQEKTAVWVGLAVTAIVISQDGDKPAGEIRDPYALPCNPQPDGSCR